MSAADLKTIETPKGNLVYDADMPMGALRSINRAAKGGDLDDLVAAFSLFLIEWPFKGNPADTEAWDALRKSEFDWVLTTITADMAAEGEA